MSFQKSRVYFFVIYFSTIDYRYRSRFFDLFFYLVFATLYFFLVFAIFYFFFNFQFFFILLLDEISSLILRLKFRLYSILRFKISRNVEFIFVSKFKFRFIDFLLVLRARLIIFLAKKFSIITRFN